MLVVSARVRPFLTDRRGHTWTRCHSEKSRYYADSTIVSTKVCVPPLASVTVVVVVVVFIPSEMDTCMETAFLPPGGTTICTPPGAVGGGPRRGVSVGAEADL